MSSIFQRMSIDDYFRMGYQHQVEGNLSAAAECYARSIELHPSAEAHTFLGWVLCLMGEVDGAISECKKALKLNPQFGNAWNDMGVYLTKKKDFKGAIHYLKKACKAKNYDNHAFPHFNLALVYAQKGMLLKAKDELKEALKLDQRFASAKEFLEQIDRIMH